MASFYSYLCLITLCCLGNVLACGEQRIMDLLASSAESDWNINKITQQDIDDFICSKTLVSAAIDCLKYPYDGSGEVEGLCEFVESAYSLFEEGNECSVCDRELMKSLRRAGGRIAREHPREFQEALAFFPL